MINSKTTRQPKPEDTQERLFKLLESIDWKLWEMYNMMKDATSTKSAINLPTSKKKEKFDE